MGGNRGSFETTRWTQIQAAKTHDLEHRRESVNTLLTRYWKPVYCYLRRKGYNNADAKDLTQGFFHEIVLGRELLQRADQTKGRFRTFLLTALDRYATSVHRKDTAKKRLPKQGLVLLDSGGLPDLPIPESKTTPELAFHYVWATNLLDHVLAKIRDEYCSTDRATHWDVFQAKVLRPIFENAESPSLTELCAECGIENERKASNMVVTVKRRFASVLKRHLQQFVHSDSEVEEEIKELVEIFSEGGAA